MIYSKLNVSLSLFLLKSLKFIIHYMHYSVSYSLWKYITQSIETIMALFECHYSNAFVLLYIFLGHILGRISPPKTLIVVQKVATMAGGHYMYCS